MPRNGENGSLLCLPKMPRIPPKPLEHVPPFDVPLPHGVHADLDHIANLFDERIAELARLNALLHERAWETRVLYQVVNDGKIASGVPARERTPPAVYKKSRTDSSSILEWEQMPAGVTRRSTDDSLTGVPRGSSSVRFADMVQKEDDAKEFIVNDEECHPALRLNIRESIRSLVSVYDIDRDGATPSSWQIGALTARSGETSIAPSALSRAADHPRYKLKDAWTDDKRKMSLNLQNRSLSSIDVSFLRASMQEYEIEEEISGMWVWMVATPSSHWRIAWEIIGAILILFDLIFTPLQVFDPPEQTLELIIEKLTLLFWTSNIYAACTVGYIDQGVLILNPKSIIIRYLKTWFWVDLLTVIPDWVAEISSWAGGTKSSAGSITKVLRALRLLRIARLLRLVKLRNAWNHLYDMIDSEKVGILLDVFKMVNMLLIVNHYVACGWYFVGKEQSGNSWLKYHGFTRDKVDWVRQYLVAYHWSITQFTPSSMHVQPNSKGERVYAICVVVGALIGFSYIVGSITGSLHRLRAMAQEETKSFWVLRRFLKKNHIEKDLGMRIRSYIESRWTHQQSTVKLCNVRVLSLLSEQLTSELQCALHGPSLCIHPLFQKLQEDCPITIQRIAIKGVEEISYAPGDYVFITGEAAQHMSIVTSGKLQYARRMMGEDAEFNDRDETEFVEELEDWIAEPVLWLPAWPHLGDLKSLTSTELLTVKPQCFVEVVRRNPMAFSMVSRYAENFVVWMNQRDEAQLSDITQGEDDGEMLWGFANDEDDEHVQGDPMITNRKRPYPWSVQKQTKCYSRENVVVKPTRRPNGSTTSAESSR